MHDFVCAKPCPATPFSMDNGLLPKQVGTGTAESQPDAERVAAPTTVEITCAPHDLLCLDELSEDSLMSTLHARFLRRQCYTYVGSILISINPFDSQLLAQSYSTSFVAKHHNQQLGALPPHLFAIAEAARASCQAAMIPCSHQHASDINQCVVITGESGAGKTEAAKLIMTYLATLGTPQEDGSGPGGDDRGLSSLRQRILAGSPVLEAFGNARTVRNDNSSRFGKLIELSVGGSTAAVQGARIATFLLEKTRMTSVGVAERSFHVLYQLAHSAPAKLLLPPPHELAYLRSAAAGDSAYGASALSVLNGCGEACVREGKVAAEVIGAEGALGCAERHRSDFVKTCAHMERVGIDLEERERVWTVLAVALLLGNVEFVPLESGHTDGTHASGGGGGAGGGGAGGGGAGGGGCRPASAAAVAAVSSLLRIEACDLEKALCTRRLCMHRGGEVITSGETVEAATRKRDTLARAIYAALFDWLLRRLNANIGSCAWRSRSGAAEDEAEWSARETEGANDVREARLGSEGVAAAAGGGGRGARKRGESGTISLLDIYGFEVLLTNSLEQLLINLANERLQQHFNRHVFELEQQEYRREGIAWETVGWQSGAPCLALLEGVLSATDDAWRVAHEDAADETLLREINAQFGETRGVGGHPCFVPARLHARTHFMVRHYAHDVSYAICGFCRKNAEALPDSLIDVAAASDALRHLTLRPLPRAFGAERGGDGGAEGAGPCGERGERLGGRMRHPSVSEQFRGQLDSLVRSVSAGRTWYVRCVKPNSEKRAWSFDEAECLGQMRSAGMIDAVRIRKRSFEKRISHDTFARRFGFLAPVGQRAGDTSALVDLLATSLRQPREAWQCGATKVFLRDGFVCALESLESARVRSVARASQRLWRRRRRHVAAAAVCAHARGALVRIRQRAARAADASRAERRSAALSIAVALQRRRRYRLAQRSAATETQAARGRQSAAAATAAVATAAATAAAATATAAALTADRHACPLGAVGLGSAAANGVASHAAKPWQRSHAGAGGVGGTGGGTGACSRGVLKLCEIPEGGLPQQALLPSPGRLAGPARLLEASAPPDPLPASRFCQRSVAQLGAPPAISVDVSTSVAQAAQLMLTHRTEALLVTDAAGAEGRRHHGGGGGGGGGVFVGILTATDIARRVLAAAKFASECKVGDHMTCAPTCIAADAAAADALAAMTRGRFRHVPVVGNAAPPAQPSAQPPAMLDVNRCLFDVINMLENAQAAGMAMMEAVDDRHEHATLGLKQAFRSVLAPTLASLARQCTPSKVVEPSATVQEAALLLTRKTTAVLVATGGRIGGLITPRSLLRAAISDASPDEMRVADGVVLPPPLTPGGDLTVLDALHMLQDHRCSHALLMTEQGEIHALFDVLQLVMSSLAHAQRSADVQRLHCFWNAALAIDGGPAESVHVGGESVHVGGEKVVDDIRPEDSISAIGTFIGTEWLPFSAEDPFLFKLRDDGGSLHRIRIAPAAGWESLRSELRACLGTEVQQVCYIDDDGDDALISSDETLVEAVQQARASKCTRLLLKTCAATAQAADQSLHTGTMQPPLTRARASGAAVGSDGAGASVPAPLDAGPPVAAAFLGGLIAASSFAVGVGMLAIKAAAGR